MIDERLEQLVQIHGCWRKSHGRRFADLRGASLFLQDLRGADLHRANLHRAYMVSSRLREIDLGRADLSGADLRWSELDGANLCGANLRTSDLRNASLCNAKLRGADLRCANLGQADLRGADLTGAKLVNANFWAASLPEDIVQIGPVGPDNDYFIYWVERDVVQFGGWRCGKCSSLEDFAEAVERDCPKGVTQMQWHLETYRAVIAMCEALRKARRARA